MWLKVQGKKNKVVLIETVWITCQIYKKVLSLYLIPNEIEGQVKPTTIPTNENTYIQEITKWILNDKTEGKIMNLFGTIIKDLYNTIY